MKINKVKNNQLKRIKTRQNILNSTSLRGCSSCNSITGQNNREVEKTRILIARAKVSSQKR
ncbi:MAG: hypothetical protein MK289_20470 [Trichodesmium sp. ALOHA_ZT_67]|nr:hypothetical protein [Trichodesmium sp. ALOHA_ZT_67]